MLKGDLQNSMNKLRNESTKLIKEVVNEIYNLRNSYASDTKGMGKIIIKVKEEVAKVKEDSRKIQMEALNCEYRVNQCEDQIGYHLLGEKFEKLDTNSGKKEENEGSPNQLGISNDISNSEKGSQMQNSQEKSVENLNLNTAGSRKMSGESDEEKKNSKIIKEESKQLLTEQS